MASSTVTDPDGPDPRRTGTHTGDTKRVLRNEERAVQRSLVGRPLDP